MKSLKLFLLSFFIVQTNFSMKNPSNDFAGLPYDVWSIILEFNLNRYALTPEEFFKPMDSIRLSSKQGKRTVDEFIKRYAEKKYKNEKDELKRKVLVDNFTYNNYKNEIVKELMEYWNEKIPKSRWARDDLMSLNSALKLGAGLWVGKNFNKSEASDYGYQKFWYDILEDPDVTENFFTNLIKMGFIGEDSFLYAVFYKKANIVKSMLKAGMNPNYIGNISYGIGSELTSPLILAIGNKENIDIIEILLGNGLLEPGYITADPTFNGSNKTIETPLEKVLSDYEYRAVRDYYTKNPVGEDYYQSIYKIFKLLINNSTNLKKEFIQSLISKANNIYSSISSSSYNKKTQSKYINEIINLLKENLRNRHK